MTLTEVNEWYEREPAPEDFGVDAGTIRAGTAAACCTSRCAAWLATKRSSCSSTSLGCATTWGRHGPSRAGQGCYRVEIKGEPNYTLDLQLMGTDGDHNTAGLKATAMRLVNAVPAVVAAPPGLVTALDLPLVTGRGLVVT